MKLQQVYEHIQFLKDEKRMFILTFLLSCEGGEASTEDLIMGWCSYRDDFREGLGKLSIKKVQECILYGMVEKTAFNRFRLTDKIKELKYILSKIDEIEFCAPNGYNEIDDNSLYTIHTESYLTHVVKYRDREVGRTLTLGEAQKLINKDQKALLKKKYGNFSKKVVI